MDEWAGASAKVLRRRRIRLPGRKRKVRLGHLVSSYKTVLTGSCDLVGPSEDTGTHFIPTQYSRYSCLRDGRQQIRQHLKLSLKEHFLFQIQVGTQFRFSSSTSVFPYFSPGWFPRGKNLGPPTECNKWVFWAWTGLCFASPLPHHLAFWVILNLTLSKGFCVHWFLNPVQFVDNFNNVCNLVVLESWASSPLESPEATALSISSLLFPHPVSLRKVLKSNPDYLLGYMPSSLPRPSSPVARELQAQKQSSSLQNHLSLSAQPSKPSSWKGSEQGADKPPGLIDFNFPKQLSSYCVWIIICKSTSP